MKLMILIPKVIQSYRNRFPETRNNAYRYFNYDRRVVQESVPRGDIVSQYKTPDDLTDADYDALVTYAKGIINPILMKYSARVACEDALSSAIRSFANGMFDSKVNAGRFAVLLDSMMGKNEVICPCLNTPPYKFSKKAPKKAPKKEEDVGLELKTPLLRQLKLQDRKKKKGIPVKERARLRKGPQIFKEKGKIILKTADGSEPNQYLMDFLNMITELPTKDMDVVRKLVGRWSQAKGLIKEFLSNCIKECDMDRGYVQQVSEEVKKAVSLLDRLEDVYQKVNEFDMDEIKTRMEPLLELIDRVKQGDTGKETPPEEGTPEAPPEEESVTETEEMDISPEKEKAMLKNAKEYAERLDKIAEEIEQVSPEAALQIDLISDVIEGRREASTLKFDPDEARYMRDRFNFDVRKREADEPYMDEFNKSDFEQVEGVKKNPEPIKKNASLPYQKVEG